MMNSDAFVKTTLRDLGRKWEQEDIWQNQGNTSIKSKALDLMEDSKGLWYSDMVLILEEKVIYATRIYMGTNGFSLLKKRQEVNKRLQQVEVIWGKYKAFFDIHHAIFVELVNAQKNSSFDGQYFAIATNYKPTSDKLTDGITKGLILFSLTEKILFNKKLSEVLNISTTRLREIIKTGLARKTYVELILAKGTEVIISIATAPVHELVQFVQNRIPIDKIKKSISIGKEQASKFHLNNINNSINSGIDALKAYRKHLHDFVIDLPFVGKLKDYMQEVLSEIIGYSEELLGFLKKNELEIKTLVGFVAGLWDGLVEALAGIIDFFILLLQGIIEIVKASREEVVQLVEEIVTAVTNIEWSKVWHYLTGEFWDDLNSYTDTGFNKFLNQNATEMGYDIAYGAVAVLENFYKPSTSVITK